MKFKLCQCCSIKMRQSFIFNSSYFTSIIMNCRSRWKGSTFLPRCFKSRRFSIDAVLTLSKTQWDRYNKCIFEWIRQIVISGSVNIKRPWNHLHLLYHIEKTCNRPNYGHDNLLNGLCFYFYLMAREVLTCRLQLIWLDEVKFSLFLGKNPRDRSRIGLSREKMSQWSPKYYLSHQQSLSAIGCNTVSTFTYCIPSLFESKVFANKEKRAVLVNVFLFKGKQM